MFKPVMIGGLSVMPINSLSDLKSEKERLINLLTPYFSFPCKTFIDTRHIAKAILVVTNKVDPVTNKESADFTIEIHPHTPIPSTKILFKSLKERIEWEIFILTETYNGVSVDGTIPPLYDVNKKLNAIFGKDSGKTKITAIDNTDIEIVPYIDSLINVEYISQLFKENGHLVIKIDTFYIALDPENAEQFSKHETDVLIDDFRTEYKVYTLLDGGICNWEQDRENECFIRS